MLIEQIIKYELRGLGPLIVNVLELVIFMTKQKSLRKIIEWINCQNIAGGNIPCFALPGPIITYKI